jgi:hypothetical protein
MGTQVALNGPQNVRIVVNTKQDRFCHNNPSSVSRSAFAHLR